MPNFFSQLDPLHPTVDFKAALIALYDAMLNATGVTDTQKEEIARLRARTQIDLNAF